MKKVILILSIAAIATTGAFAQTEKGNFLLGGSAEFKSEKTGSGTAVTSAGIAPTIGYFVHPDLAVGATLDISTVKDSYTSFAIAPLVRYYFLPLGDHAKLFANATIGFGSMKPKSGSSQSLTAWEISAGPAFFLNSSVAFETVLAYSSVKFKNAADATNSIGVKLGFQIHLKKGGKK